MVISETYLYKGAVATTADLPADETNVGAVYVVMTTLTGSSAEYICTAAATQSANAVYEKLGSAACVLDQCPSTKFRTHCNCCGSLMPRTEAYLNTCEHCGATQSTYETE